MSSKAKRVPSDRVIISIDFPIKMAYAAVPKAACTTVKHIFLQLDDTPPPSAGPSDPSDPKFDIHLMYNTRRFKRRNWAGTQDHFRFTVLRDPLARLLSVYTNRVIQKRILYEARKLRNRRPDLPLDPDPDFFFQNLQTYIDHSSDVKHHALPCRLFTGPDLGFYSKVYRIEETDQLQADIEAMSGRTLTVRRHNSSPSKLSLDALQPATRAAIHRQLAPQYQDVAGYYDNPFA